MRLEETVNISHNGQITLPPSIRATLHGDTVRLAAEDGVVKLEPAHNYAGSLKKYAMEYVPLDAIREQIWSEGAHENGKSD
jgi:hypothetical protein